MNGYTGKRGAYKKMDEVCEQEFGQPYVVGDRRLFGLLQLLAEVENLAVPCNQDTQIDPHLFVEFCNRFAGTQRQQNRVMERKLVSAQLFPHELGEFRTHGIAWVVHHHRKSDHAIACKHQPKDNNQAHKRQKPAEGQGSSTFSGPYERGEAGLSAQRNQPFGSHENHSDLVRRCDGIIQNQSDGQVWHRRLRYERNVMGREQEKARCRMPASPHSPKIWGCVRGVHAFEYERACFVVLRDSAYQLMSIQSWLSSDEWNRGRRPMTPFPSPPCKAMHTAPSRHKPYQLCFRAQICEQQTGG